jgi:hypothetical protein
MSMSKQSFCDEFESALPVLALHNFYDFPNHFP